MMQSQTVVHSNLLLITNKHLNKIASSYQEKNYTQIFKVNCDFICIFSMPPHTNNTHTKDGSKIGKYSLKLHQCCFYDARV